MTGTRKQVSYVAVDSESDERFSGSAQRVGYKLLDSSRPSRVVVGPRPVEVYIVVRYPLSPPIPELAQDYMGRIALYQRDHPNGT